MDLARGTGSANVWGPQSVRIRSRVLILTGRLGDLTQESMSSGVTRAKTAVTQADLDVLFIDLPRGARGFLESGRETIMALSPFAAMALFFTTGQWLWFLMIPVMGILLYGPEGGRKAGRRRSRGQSRGQG